MQNPFWLKYKKNTSIMLSLSTEKGTLANCTNLTMAHIQQLAQLKNTC